MRRAPSLVAPSSRLLALLAGDLPEHRRAAGEDGWARFVPNGGGPTLSVAARVERRFLGRTEVAVFQAVVGGPVTGDFAVTLSHAGGLRRSGLTGNVDRGGEAGARVSQLLGSDRELAEALLPLDFTRFEIEGDSAGTRARLELMGASHVAMALPPIRSYVHLYPDQREAMTAGLVRLGALLGSL